MLDSMADNGLFFSLALGSKINGQGQLLRAAPPLLCQKFSFVESSFPEKKCTAETELCNYAV